MCAYQVHLKQTKDYIYCRWRSFHVIKFIYVEKISNTITYHNIPTVNISMCNKLSVFIFVHYPTFELFHNETFKI